MNKVKLQNADREVVKTYVSQKFRSYRGWTYSKASRRKKCIEYWRAADGTPHGQQVVQDVYFNVFNEVFPTQEARSGMAALRIGAQAIAGPAVVARGPALPKAPEAVKPLKPPKPSSGLDDAENRVAELEYALKQLRLWETQHDWEEGERFLLELRSFAGEYIEARVFEESEFETQWDARRVASLTRSASVGPFSAEAEFDLMIGYKQSGGVQFKTKPRAWGTISGQLEESFRAGAWARGSASAKLSELGLDAEASLSIALGMQLDIEGTLSWEKAGTGLRLGGKSTLFAGARGSAEATLSVKAREGLTAAFKAEAFAGFSASVEGSCAVTRNGRALVTATGTAEVQFGVGGKIEGSIAATIFGPTEISFETSAALGLGTGVGASVEIDFAGIYLAGREDFRRIMYLPTLAQGYQATLINQDHRNRFYLEKCIKHVEVQLADLEEAMENEEGRPLLLGARRRSDD